MTLNLVKFRFGSELIKLTASAFLHVGLALGVVGIVGEHNPDCQRLARPCLPGRHLDAGRPGCAMGDFQKL
jgi:hypothetical protein